MVFKNDSLILCYGTFASLIFMSCFRGNDYRTSKIKQKDLNDALLKSVGIDHGEDNTTASKRFRCISDVNSYLEPSAKKLQDSYSVINVFQEKIVPEIVPTKKSQLVAAILELIENDNTISDSIVVELISETKKNDLQRKPINSLATFLSGVFLYIAKYGPHNTKGKETYAHLAEIFEGSIDKAMLFDDIEETISEKRTESQDDDSTVSLASTPSLQQSITEIKEDVHSIAENVRDARDSGRPVFKSPFAQIQKRNYSPRFDIREMVDRVNVIPDIAAKLQDEMRPVYIQAFGGLGKSTVAQAFSRNEEYAKQYDFIFWIDVKDSGDDIRRDLIDYEQFDFRTEDDSDIETDFTRFTAQARDLDGKVLLIIDNVTRLQQIDGIETIANHLPWQILVTSRAEINDKKFQNRMVHLKELEDIHCEKLFYDNYDSGEESFELNRPLLHEIFLRLRYHTYLIKLIAKVGYRNYSVQAIHDMLIEKGCFHEGLQVEFFDEGAKYANLYQKIKAIYDFDDISKEEEIVLRYFTLLPDRAISEDIIFEWIKGGLLPNDAIQIKNILQRLADKGWLIRERNKNLDTHITTYKCHNIIQMSLYDSDVSGDQFSIFYTNMKDYFWVEEGMPNYHLISYLDCAESVLIKTERSTHQSLELMREYLRLLGSQGQTPQVQLKYATKLRDEYVLVTDKDDEYNWAVGLCRAHSFYAEAYLEATSDAQRFMSYCELRKDVFELSQRYLQEDDIWYVRFERSYAISKRRVPGRGSESLLDLEKVKDKIIGIKEKYDDPVMQQKWLLLLMITYAALGISYQRESVVEKHAGNQRARMEHLKTALGYRYKRLDLSLEYSHVSLPTAYNDLGMNLLGLYEAGDENSQYLIEAEKYLTESYQIRIGIFGENSIKSALALSNLALLRRQQGFLKEALEKYLFALEIRTFYHGDRKTRSFLMLHTKIALVCYELWEKEHDDEMLINAKDHADLAIENGDIIYKEDKDQPEYRTALDLQEKIDKAFIDNDS